MIDKHKWLLCHSQSLYYFYIFTAVLRAPNGIRTRVTAVKGRCPRPLDDGDVRGWAILPAIECVTKPDIHAQKSHQVAFAGAGGFLVK